MNAPRTCAVHGCEGERMAVFTTSEEDRREFAVCDFHFQALSEGEPFLEDESRSRRGLLLGSDLPPQLLNVEWTRHAEGEIVLTVVLGRDDVEEQSVPFRISPEMGHGFIKALTRILPKD